MGARCVLALLFHDSPIVERQRFLFVWSLGANVYGRDFNATQRREHAFVTILKFDPDPVVTQFSKLLAKRFEVSAAKGSRRSPGQLPNGHRHRVIAAPETQDSEQNAHVSHIDLG